MHIDNTIGRGHACVTPPTAARNAAQFFLKSATILGSRQAARRLLESLVGDKGLVRHAGFLRRLRALVQLAHEALEGRQLGFCERLAEVGDGGLHQGEDCGLVRGDDVDGIAFGGGYCDCGGL